MNKTSELITFLILMMASFSSQAKVLIFDCYFTKNNQKIDRIESYEYDTSSNKAWRSGQEYKAELTPTYLILRRDFEWDDGSRGRWKVSINRETLKASERNELGRGEISPKMTHCEMKEKVAKNKF